MGARAWRVALAQLAGRGGSIEERVDRAVALAKGVPRDLLVLPEAYLPGYDHIAAEAEGPARRLAEQLGGVVVVSYLADGACQVGIADGAAWWRYTKQFPSPAERRAWRAGVEPGIAPTSLGRIGVLVCADALQLSAWEALRGRVDLVVVPSAWPDYRGRTGPAVPLTRWLASHSGPYRDELLGRAARSLGVPVVFANAVGLWRGAERFTGGSSAWDGDGARVAGPFVEEGVHPCLVHGAAPRGALTHPLPWRLLTAAWRIRR